MPGFAATSELSFTLNFREMDAIVSRDCTTYVVLTLFGEYAGLRCAPREFPTGTSGAELLRTVCGECGSSTSSFCVLTCADCSAGVTACACRFVCCAAYLARH